MAHERLTEPRFTIKWLLPKPSSVSDLPAFLGPNGTKYTSQTGISGSLSEDNLVLIWKGYKYLKTLQKSFKN